MWHQHACTERKPWQWPNDNNIGYKCAKTTAGVRKIARVARADRSAEELDRETGEEQTTVGRTRRKDGGWQTTKESGRVTWGGQDETRAAKAEMGCLCWERWEEGRRGGRLEEDGKKQGRVEKTIRWGGEEVADSTPPLIKGKEKERSREIDPKHDTPNNSLYCPLTCLNNTERKIVLTATGLGLWTLMLELWKPVLVPRPEAMGIGNATMTVRSVRRPYGAYNSV